MKAFFVGLLLAATVPTWAQEALTYQKPPAEILQLAEYDRAPGILMDSKKDWLVFSYRPTYKTLDDLNQDELKLAGLRVNPVTNIASTVTYINNLKIRKRTATTETQVQGLPANPRISFLSFSPDESKLAFTHTTAKGVELWVLDLASATARKLTSDNLNANLGSPYTWYKSSDALLVKQLPQDCPALLSTKGSLPAGPTVSTSDGKVSQNRTYQDLLKTPMDETNFETLIRSTLVQVPLSGTAQPVRETGAYTGMSFSPNGQYLMLTTVQRPYSYIVPYYRFPTTTTMYDSKGGLVKVVNEVPRTEVMPKGFSAVRTGKREMDWRDDEPATLVYAEALDGGDPAQKVAYRDALYIWDAPFSGTPKPLFKTVQRYNGIEWGTGTVAVVTDNWYDTRSQRTYLLNPTTGASRLIEDRNYQDVYSDPGSFTTKRNTFGRKVIDLNANKAYLIGSGFTKDGQFPFIDEMDLTTLKKKRLYTSKPTNGKETIYDIIDLRKGEVLVVEESSTRYPNYAIRNIRSGKSQPLTRFANPFGALKDVHKEVIHYKRKDGVDLTGTLYLPAGYDLKAPNEKLPLLIWAYPAEYKDKNTAGQNTQNPNDFTFPYYGSFVYWVAKGYAVLDDAAFPIIGEGKTEPNDSFIPQLTANAEAAIDALDQRGYIDRKRVAVGGHSYGAFMTANLLTHTNLFACGIARSGAYNRTLTPFGFQSEQRNYWDVPDVYNTMSPFMNADKMKTPLLLIHGDADNNPGTFTLQTERYFQALKNMGAPVRMVLLPKEAHGYMAKENILHVLWEQDQWLQKYLKK
ncbi:MAG: S9 family peptidase [Sphingobacteriales bacterium]|nr:MAG: S9 family peptidase [Sphingobacteriales bacterium]